jgi:diaminohydroxyphosphoribosylaminopyrimidine deaminase/5-amino-6-(5-phosphoribosylamino)uracil reductase
VKLAISLDARTALADGTSKWISGEPARADVQRWRARSSALLTASGTVRADDPQLTVRMPETEESDPLFVPPLRVVLDTGLATPAGAHVIDGSAPTLVLHAPNARRAAHFDKVECVPVEMRGSRLDLDAVLALLATRGCNEVQVEAGATLAGAWLLAGLVDELLLYVAPVLLGDEARPLLYLPPLTTMAARHELRTIERRVVGEDLRLLLRPKASRQGGEA